MCVFTTKLLAKRVDAKFIVSEMIIMCKKVKYSALISEVGKIIYVPQKNVCLRPKVTIHNIFISPKARSSSTKLS